MSTYTGCSSVMGPAEKQHNSKSNEWRIAKNERVGETNLIEHSFVRNIICWWPQSSLEHWCALAIVFVYYIHYFEYCVTGSHNDIKKHTHIYMQSSRINFKNPSRNYLYFSKYGTYRSPSIFRYIYIYIYIKNSPHSQCNKVKFTWLTSCTKNQAFERWSHSRSEGRNWTHGRYAKSDCAHRCCGTISQITLVTSISI